MGRFTGSGHHLAPPLGLPPLLAKLWGSVGTRKGRSSVLPGKSYKEASRLLRAWIGDGAPGTYPSCAVERDH